MMSDLDRHCALLADGDILRLPDRAGSSLAVFRGRVWVTQDSDPRDVVVDAGETVLLDRPGLTLVQAFGPASVMVIDAEPSPDEFHAMTTHWPVAIDVERGARARRGQILAKLVRRVWAAVSLQIARRWPASRSHVRVVQC